MNYTFLTAERQKRSIDENVAPGCPHLPSKGPFALELAGGWFQRHPT